MKLFLAAPESGLPSLPTALVSHASSLHFLTKLVFAAPVKGLPSLLTALVSQDCAMAAPTEKEAIRIPAKMRFIIPSILQCGRGLRTRCEKMLYAPTAGHEQTPEFLKEFRAGSSMSCKLVVLLLKLDPSPILTFVPRYFSVPFFFERSVLSSPESMVAFMIASMSVGPCK